MRPEPWHLCCLAVLGCLLHAATAARWDVAVPNAQCADLQLTNANQTLELSTESPCLAFSASWRRRAMLAAQVVIELQGGNSTLNLGFGVAIVGLAKGM